MLFMHALFIMKNFITTLVLSVALFAIFVGLVALSYSTTPNRVYADSTSNRVGKIKKQHDARPTGLANTLAEPREPIIEISLIDTEGKVLGESTSLLGEPSTYFSTFSSFVPFTDLHYVDNHHVFTNEEIGVCYCGPQALRTQNCLKDLGFFNESQEFTGCFGRGETTRAVQSFQASCGISETSPASAVHGAGDAWLGDETISALNALCYGIGQNPCIGGEGGSDQGITQTTTPPRRTTGPRTTSSSGDDKQDERYDLALEKTATPIENGLATFTITIVNEGTEDVGEYSFDDYLPSATAQVTANGSSIPDGSDCGQDEIDITCVGVNLSPGESHVYTFVVKPQIIGDILNTAQIISHDEGKIDADSTPGSGVDDDEDDTASATSTEPEEEEGADFGVFRSGNYEDTNNNEVVDAGDKVIFTYTIANEADVQINDIEVEESEAEFSGTLANLEKPTCTDGCVELGGNPEIKDLGTPAGTTMTLARGYTITEADVAAKSISGVATVRGLANGKELSKPQAFTFNLPIQEELLGEGNPNANGVKGENGQVYRDTSTNLTYVFMNETGRWSLNMNSISSKASVTNGETVCYAGSIFSYNGEDAATVNAETNIAKTAGFSNTGISCPE